ncbi:hypothetical protein J6590_020018 [Homalodisca vitripennis]|nr:hypothetical protein J6590_020018 [Homalodisca vitripennis]
MSEALRDPRSMLLSVCPPPMHGRSPQLPPPRPCSGTSHRSAQLQRFAVFQEPAAMCPLSKMKRSHGFKKIIKPKFINQVKEQLLPEMDGFHAKGSRWTLHGILHLKIRIKFYIPIRGFIYIGRSLPHSTPWTSKPERLHHYQPFEHELDMCTQARKKFEKDFFKLKNNSDFGKTIENIRNGVDTRLATKNERVDKWMAQQCKSRMIHQTVGGCSHEQN